jgi:hypothetical protein
MRRDAPVADQRDTKVGPPPDNEPIALRRGIGIHSENEERSPRSRRAGVSLMRGDPDRVTPSIRSHAGATLLVIAGLMIAPAWSAMSSTADDQDACQIGAVSPEEYQTIAAEAAAMPPIDWPEIHEDRLGLNEDLDDRVAGAIRDRVQDAIASHESSDEKVAAMHAVLRTIGAEFAWARVGQSYEDSGARRVPAVWYYYRIDVNRLRVLRPLFRWGRIDVSFYTDESWQTIGDLRHVAFHIPVPFSPSISGLKNDLPQTRACPPIPEEAERPVRHQEREQE